MPMQFFFKRHLVLAGNVALIPFAGGIKCVKNVTIHNAAILSINAGEHWLGVGAADNSMSLFHRPQERLGGFSTTGSKMGGWQLYRTPQKTVAMVCILPFSPMLLLFSISCFKMAGYRFSMFLALHMNFISSCMHKFS